MTELDLIGKPRHEAIDLLLKENIRYRLTSVDGKVFIVTRDYVPERLNLTIVNGLITKVDKG